MSLPVRRVVLYKHGVGFFEREGTVEGQSAITLSFRQAEVSDVLKSLTVLDLDGGRVASVSYDSTKPLEQLLADVALNIPDKASLVSLLPQIKGARVALHTGVSDPVEGSILGIDATERPTGDGVVKVVLLSIVTDKGDVRQFDLHALAAVRIIDATLRADLDYYLRTQLSSKKKDSKEFTFFTQGEGRRRIRVSYTLEAPVWKATYRILLSDEPATPSLIQGWAVVDNTQDEDWEDVSLSLIAGLPVSFVHDLYTPRYIRRPEVKVQETTGVLPPTVEEGMEAMFLAAGPAAAMSEHLADDAVGAAPRKMRKMLAKQQLSAESLQSSTPAQVRARKIGDLFEYEIEHPVTIRRNQSALVPIVLRSFEGRPVLLYNKLNRAENPMRSVEFKNTTGLTLEGGPVTVLEGDRYVGEAMLDTLKPDEERLIPYAVELSVRVLDNVESTDERVHRIVVRRGNLRAHYSQVQHTTYHFDNKSDREMIVYLEHPRGGAEWKLFDTPPPKEVTESFWRFRFTIAAKQVTAFSVRQRKVLHQAFALADVFEKQLDLWLEQKYLDDRTEKSIREIISLRYQATLAERSLQQLETERGKIHEEQARIRENLQALADRAAEKELRERFVKTLNSQEDRLEQLQKEVLERTRERDALRDRLNEALTKLEYEAEVP